jgi:hypothetical protein
MGLAGAAAGAQDALQALLLQAFQRQQAEQQMAIQQQAAERQDSAQRLQERQFNADETYRAGQVNRQATQDRQGQNQQGVRRMIGDFLMQRGSQPLDQGARNQIAGMAVSEDVDLPRGLADAPPAPEPFTLSPGSKRFGPDGQEIASVAPTPPQPRDERLVQVMGPQGTPIWVRESEAVNKPAAQAARAVTGQERQALAYYNRAKDASDTITTTGLEDRVSKSGMGTQLGLQYAPNIMQTPDQQAYRQAQRAFTEARLRKESGAAIPAGEYENDAKTYFAQPGDDAATVDQKRHARQVVLDGLKFGSGKAYEEFYGDSGTGAGAPRPTGSAPNRVGRFEIVSVQ